MFDFYLQPHRPLQGTAKPCHYVVLHDEVFTTELKKLPNSGINLADFVQDITFKLCYLWQVSTTAVSVVPPAFYADRLCDRLQRWFAHHFDSAQSTAGSDDGGPPTDLAIHPNLRDSMFYV